MCIVIVAVKCTVFIQSSSSAYGLLWPNVCYGKSVTAQTQWVVLIPDVNRKHRSKVIL